MPDGMQYAEFLDAVIDDGADEVRRRYAHPDQRASLEAALEGGEACRGLSHDAILALRDASMAEGHRLFRSRDPGLRQWRLREAQIEWVLDVVSAGMFARDMTFVFPPTARGMDRAESILGIAVA